MPTPFTHLAYAARILRESGAPQSVHAALTTHEPAFLLGAIAADAQTICQVARHETHFYTYDTPIRQPPYQVMLAQFPALAHPRTAEQRAFLAGYVVHLALDEVWTRDMTAPHFAQREWAPRQQRFLALHLLLITLDERDHAGLSRQVADLLSAARPDDWLPFLTDDQLVAWRDVVARQIGAPARSETLAVLAPRVGLEPEKLRRLVDSPDVLDRDVWAHVPQALLAEIEARMTQTARNELLAYLAATDD